MKLWVAQHKEVKLTGEGWRETEAVEMSKWWLEPKIRSHSPFFPSLGCQSFSPALSIMSSHCDFESVKQSLSGQAVPAGVALERQAPCVSRPLQFGWRQLSDTNSSESPLFAVIVRIPGCIIIGPRIEQKWLYYQRIWFGFKHSDLCVMWVGFRLARSERRKSHTRA